MTSDTFKFDPRPRIADRRHVRDGDKLHTEIRSNIIEKNGDITYGEWIRIGTLINVFKKPKPWWKFW